MRLAEFVDQDPVPAASVLAVATLNRLERLVVYVEGGRVYKWRLPPRGWLCDAHWKHGSGRSSCGILYLLIIGAGLYAQVGREQFVVAGNAGVPITVKFADHVAEVLTAGPVASDVALPFMYYV